MGTGTSLQTWLSQNNSYCAFVKIWYDQSSTGNHATQNTTTLQPMLYTTIEKPNYDLLFSLTNEITLTATSKISYPCLAGRLTKYINNTYTGCMTVSMWINTTSSNVYLFGLSPNSYNNFTVYIDTVGNLNFLSTSVAANNNKSCNVKVNTGNWVHIAVVQYETTITYYVDGSNTGVSIIAINNKNYGSTIVDIGWNSSNNTSHFVGKMNNINVYGILLYCKFI